MRVSASQDPLLKKGKGERTVCVCGGGEKKELSLLVSTIFNNKRTLGLALVPFLTRL